MILMVDLVVRVLGNTFPCNKCKFSSLTFLPTIFHLIGNAEMARLYKDMAETHENTIEILFYNKTEKVYFDINMKVVITSCNAKILR